jgi:hypothetical protein
VPDRLDFTQQVRLEIGPEAMGGKRLEGLTNREQIVPDSPSTRVFGQEPLEVRALSVA